MAITDAPTVSINGVTLARTWSLTTRIALGGLAITWGRRSHLEQASPATLTLEVLDTDGQIANSAEMIGQRVIVRRADDRIIFRGRVDTATIDRVILTDPDTNRKRRVWRYTVTAADPLADLAKARLRGPENNPASVAWLGENYWPIQRPAARLADVMAAGASGVVAGIDWADPYPITEFYPWMRHRGHADQFSALNHVEGVFAARPLAYVRHDPHTNRLSAGAPAQTVGVELTWDGDTLDIALPSGQTVPARTVAMPNGYSIRSSHAEAIDVVQIVGPQPSSEDLSSLLEVTTERNTARYSMSNTGRTEHRVVNEIWHSLFISGGETKRFVWPFPLDVVTSEFGWRSWSSSFHEGMDFSGGPAVSGATVPAIGDGVVIESQYHSGWGNYVLIDHGAVNGARLRSRYAHLLDPGVPVGTDLSQGDRVGDVGSTGNSTGAHLHLETIVNGAAIDPRVFIPRYENVAPPRVEGIWQGLLADATVGLLNQLNGKVAMPSIRLDWRHFTYPAALTAALLDATTKPTALYFPGSVFAPVYDVATEHQVIGGTLVYYKGWTLDATLAPAIRTRAGITINQLVTIDAPLISDFDDDLLLADIGNVTKGVTS